MPFKSVAQMHKFFAMEKKGELPKGTAEKWAKHTMNIKKLPKYVKGSKSEPKGMLLRGMQGKLR